MSKPVALILGAGPGIGAAVVNKFAKIGYNVAMASRSGSGAKTADGFLSLKADFTKPETIPPLFESIKAEFQAAPSVVVYNAAIRTPPPVQDDIFSTSADTLVSDMNVNTISPYVAAQQAVAGWKTLPSETKKAFIYTGNILNVKVLPMTGMITLGMGKSASAYWIGTADALHQSQGYRFIYADERYEDGRQKGGAIDGDAHAEFYAQVAAHEGNVPWHATFVKDKGYVSFM